MKQLDECSNIEDIRSEIDRIDRQIVAAFGTRFGYVKAASKFKTSETSVKAPQRFEAMLPEDEMKAPAFMHGDEIASRFQPPVNIVFYFHVCYNYANNTA